MRTQEEIQVLSDLQELTDRWGGGVCDRNAWSELMTNLRSIRGDKPFSADYTQRKD